MFYSSAYFKMKKRILVVGESSFVSTGFATYQLELLKHLHSTGKYDLAELGCQAQPDDPRQFSTPWKYFNNAPKNNEENERFNGDAQFKYCKFRFNHVCKTFRPHIVIDVRDPYMTGFLIESAFRPRYKLCFMPPIDGEPQEEIWVALYKNADKIVTYTDYGSKVLAYYGVQTHAVAPPGADSIYRMTTDKKLHKSNVNLDPDSFIVGTLMRNQPRKLYPDLMHSFARFLEKAPKSLSEKSYLYLHCADPDIGWNIGELAVEYGITARTLITYHCQICGISFPSVYSGPLCYCRACKNNSARTVNSLAGVSRKDLCNIFNLLDVYVQYSTCEGFGMPQVEANACGVPLISVDHSAMGEVCYNVGGDLIPNLRPWKEHGSGRILANPDNDKLVETLIRLGSEPECVRMNMGSKQQQISKKLYSYEQSMKRWEKVIDDIEVEDSWAEPFNMPSPAQTIPSGLNPQDFVDWGLVNVSRRPELAGTYYSRRMSHDLVKGKSYIPYYGFFVNDLSCSVNNLMPKDFTPEIALDVFTGLWNDKNFWENQRCLVKTA